MNLPTEILVPIIAALLAGTGYLFKSVVDWFQEQRNEKARTIAQLEKLQSLLNAARTIFNLQQAQVSKLLEKFNQNHPGESLPVVGYEEAMETSYPHFNKDEKELHGIIRAYTQHSLRPINLAILEWLRADSLFRTGVVKSKRREHLARNLVDLEIHLLLWNGKYKAWIPGQPHHALVYLGDEKEHGLGFPRDREILVQGQKVRIDGTDKDVGAVLKELRG